MNMNSNFFQRILKRNIALGLAIGLAVSLFALSSLGAARGGGGPSGGGQRGGSVGPGRAAGPSRPAFAPSRPAMTDRTSHGTIRHLDSHVVQRPVQIRPEPQRGFEGRREFAPGHDAFVHHDVDVDLHRRHAGNDFVFHRHFRTLPFGFLNRPKTAMRKFIRPSAQ